MNDKIKFSLNFSQAIRTKKEDLNISVRRIAKDVGKSPTYIQKILEGFELPSYQLYIDLCRLFDIKPVNPEEYPLKGNTAKDWQIKELQTQNQLYKEALEKIVNNAPACFRDDDCPVNGGAGYDNHCTEDKCHIMIAKQALEE